MYYTTKDYENNINLCGCAMYRLAENIANTEFKELKNFLDTTDKDFVDICNDLDVNFGDMQIISGDFYVSYKYKDISGVATYVPKDKTWHLEWTVDVIFADKINLPPIENVKITINC